MKHKAGNICQSCGMPIRTIADFGTHEDGSINTEYCRYCFKEGDFLDAGITMEEKIKKNIALSVAMGISRAEARQRARAVIPGLRRWQKKRFHKVP